MLTSNDLISQGQRTLRAILVLSVVGSLVIIAILASLITTTNQVNQTVSQQLVTSAQRTAARDISEAKILQACKQQ